MIHGSLAIVASAPNEPPVINEVILDELRPDEAYIEVHAVGVCLADLAVLHGHIPLPFPRVLGDEGESQTYIRGRDPTLLTDLLI